MRRPVSLPTIVAMVLRLVVLLRWLRRRLRRLLRLRRRRLSLLLVPVVVIPAPSKLRSRKPGVQRRRAAPRWGGRRISRRARRWQSGFGRSPRL